MKTDQYAVVDDEMGDFDYWIQKEMDELING
jgi:hypothetical protein